MAALLYSRIWGKLTDQGAQVWHPPDSVNPTFQSRHRAEVEGASGYPSGKRRRVATDSDTDVSSAHFPETHPRVRDPTPSFSVSAHLVHAPSCWYSRVLKEVSIQTDTSSGKAWGKPRSIPAF
jgi:hypothetical protein